MELNKKISGIFIMAALVWSFFYAGLTIFEHPNPANSSEKTNGSAGANLDSDKAAKEAERAKRELEESRKRTEEEQKQKEAALDQKLTDLQTEVKSFLETQPGTFGFELYVKLDVGERLVEKTIGYNETQSFMMASTYKVPVNLYLYQQVAAKKLTLDDKLVYQSKFYAAGTGSLQYTKPGGSYTVGHLASLSIRQSDNVALRLLVNRLGRGNILQFMKSMGGTAVYTDTPWATPNDLVIYMKGVKDFAESNPQLGELLIKDLKNTIFNDRIRAGTPPEIDVAHKIGNLGGVINDVGIVYLPQGPYVLAFMSKNVPNDKAAADAEAKVAKMIYEALSK